MTMISRLRGDHWVESKGVNLANVTPPLLGLAIVETWERKPLLVVTHLKSGKAIIKMPTTDWYAAIQIAQSCCIDFDWARSGEEILADSELDRVKPLIRAAEDKFAADQGLEVPR